MQRIVIRFHLFVAVLPPLPDDAVYLLVADLLAPPAGDQRKDLLCLSLYRQRRAVLQDIEPAEHLQAGRLVLTR